MARVQLIIPDEERDRFVHEARREGMTLSAWLRAAGRQRLKERERAEPFESPADVRAFFAACDTLEGSESEPEWEDHLKVIAESRRGGAPLL